MESLCLLFKIDADVMDINVTHLQVFGSLQKCLCRNVMFTHYMHIEQQNHLLGFARKKGSLESKNPSFFRS
jgi:hypothetical protein